MGLFELYSDVRGVMNSAASALIILLIGFVIGRVLGRLVLRGLHELEVDRFLEKAGVRLKFEELAGAVVEYFAYFVTVLIVLDRLGVAVFVLHAITVLVLVVLLIAFVLGVKDFIPNVIAGIRLHRARTFRVGDVVSVGSVTGRVREFGLVEATLISRNKEVIHVPNYLFVKEKVVVKKRS